MQNPFVVLVILIISLICVMANAVIGSGDLIVGAAEKDSRVNNVKLNQLQVDVARRWHKYKKPKVVPTFSEFCYPRSYKIQRQQAFIGEYMAPRSGLRPGDTPKPKEILAFHAIGAGKTCMMIQAAEPWLSYGKPLIIMPAALIPGFYNEMRSGCTGDKYISADSRAQLALAEPKSAEYKRIVAASNAHIDKYYNIYSYNKFAELTRKPSAPIIIVDEIQNINKDEGAFHDTIKSWIDTHPTASILLTSATPIFDSVEELNVIARLLRLTDTVVVPRDVARVFNGHISYFAGAPSHTYPDVFVHIVHCHMSPYQTNAYEKSLEGTHAEQNDFYNETRQFANVAYPRGLIGEEGLAALTPAMIREHLPTYSTKMAKLMKKLSKRKLSFIYSTYRGPAGIDLITKCLRNRGYKDYFADGPGRRRYVVWSGEETAAQKDEIRAVFNNSKNDDASQIQIVVGSPSIREGASLLRVRQVHVMELYWNHSRLDQIFGRTKRYCSHKSLPKKDRNVTIYLYAAIAHMRAGVQPPTTYTPATSIDLYMLQTADEKKEEADPFLQEMMNISIDRGLNE